MEDAHTFDEYCTVNTQTKNGLTFSNLVTFRETNLMSIFYLQYIEKFRSLAKELMSLPSIEHYDMIRLDCEDLKRGLSDAAKGLADVLLDRVATDHRNECQG